MTTSKTPQPKLIRNLCESASSEERHRRTSGSISEDSSETKKLCDKGRTHSFILELEQGSQEALKQRSVGKSDRLSRKELHIKERKEKERSLQKQEKKSEHQADESQQKEGVKVSSEEKGEKKPKIKSEKKITGNTREGKISVSESIAEEGPKDAKKVKTSSTEAAKAEKDKEKEKDKIKEKEKEKDKSKEKEKLKGEKTSAKSDFKQLQRPDSAGSSEDRSDMEPGSESSKKKDKQKEKEILKRSKSHSEDRQGEKPKPKTDSKDSEKEKTKADQDSQKSNKSTSETDKDPKRVKSTEKGKTVEKSKSKSKDETKTLSKTDKKVQSSEVRSAGAASISKLEMTKEKKKEGNAKEQQKVSEEPSHEKSENKSTKKKLEKKDKVTEKKDESQEETKEPREEKVEKSDKSSKSSVSSLSLETEEKQPLLQDTSTDSDPVTTTVTTSFSDDTSDALSDITPEPAEGETQSRLSEMPAVPAEADALLTLMDVCTSAEAQLPPESLQEDVNTKMVLQDDADMKMKEAALTLLSMDPDSTVSSNLIIHDARDESEVNEAAPQPTEIPAAQEEQHPPMDVQTAAEAAFTSTELSTAAPQQTAELVEEKPNTAGT